MPFSKFRRIMIARHLTRMTSSVSTPTRFSVEALCSAENRSGCIKRMQNMPHINLSNEPAQRTAAVLIPLLVHEGRLSLLYTVRAANMSRHSNEVSFPGGIRDESDASYTACAIREAREECGFRVDQIDVWGEGRTMLTHKRAPSITPVVGFIHNYDESQLQLSANEVAEVFVVPLDVLCDAENPRHTQFRNAKSGYSVPAFLGGRHRIWGITALITHMFLMALMPDVDTYGRRTIQYLPRMNHKL